ncbi:MAG TPA: GNAT family N-acetyltransferase [Longimicrobiales bacterium]|nr:GNAT family N-acetyltransferase [Longimicrobiales bacterium]
MHGPGIQLPAALLDKEGRPFVVRRLRTDEDRPALEAMYRDFEPKRGAQGLPPLEKGLARWLDRVLAAGTHLGVILEGELVGHVMLLPIGEGRVELANFLHQSIRNRGIGTWINRIALDEARRAGMHSVWLCVEPFNRAAVRSYEKAGFRRLPGSLWESEIEMEAELG